MHFPLWGRNASYDACDRAVSMADTQEQAEGKNREMVFNLALLEMMGKMVND